MILSVILPPRVCRFSKLRTVLASGRLCEQVRNSDRVQPPGSLSEGSRRVRPGSPLITSSASGAMVCEPVFCVRVLLQSPLHERHLEYPWLSPLENLSR